MKEYIIEITETATKKVAIKIPDGHSIEEFYDDICEDVNRGYGEMNIDEYGDVYDFNRDWKVIIENSKEKEFTTLPVIKYGKDEKK